MATHWHTWQKMTLNDTMIYDKLISVKVMKKENASRDLLPT